MCRKAVGLIFAAALLWTGCATTKKDTVSPAACDCTRQVRVPDKAFRTFLVDNGYAKVSRKRTMKPTAEGCALRSINCYNQGIGSLQGIEMFPQLEQLTCSDNPIGELDLTVLPRLRRFYCNNVPLRRIYIHGCDNLSYIELGYTKLRELYLTGCAGLDSLFCIFAPIRVIDLSPCPRLKTLYLRGTYIEEIDLRNNPMFHLLHGQDSRLCSVVITPAQYDADVLLSVGDSVKVRVIPED